MEHTSGTFSSVGATGRVSKEDPGVGIEDDFGAAFELVGTALSLGSIEAGRA
jgi:hypothetical protein